VVQPRGNADLAEEAVAAQGLRQLGPQHLERHVAPVLEILGQEHQAHAALAQLSLDAIPIRQGLPEVGEKVHDGAQSGSGEPAVPAPGDW